MYIVSQFVFGYGVGGEYPMAAGSAAERAEAGGKAMAKKRGREVVLTFSMQVSFDRHIFPISLPLITEDFKACLERAQQVLVHLFVRTHLVLAKLSS